MKFAKIESVYRPNLLINGDFNVNQRGQSSYSGESAKATYTLDMWYLSASAYVSATINSDGSVTFTNSHLSSELSLSQGIGGEPSYPLTAVIKLQGEEPVSANFTAAGRVAISDDCAVQIMDDGNGHIFQIRCSAGKSITIEYAALYEGEVAFNHVREDYATALMRCERYLEVGQYICYGHGDYWIEGFTYRTPKNDIPTVTIQFVINDGGTVQKSFEAVAQNSYACPFIRLTTGSAASVTGVLNVAAQISCEP